MLVLADQLEAAVQHSLRRALRRTAAQFQPALTAAGDSPAGLGPSDLNVLQTYWQEEVDGVLVPYVGEVYTGSAATVALGLAEGFPVGEAGVSLLPDDLELAYMKTVTGDFVGIGAEAWQDARTVLVDGIAQGQSIPQIAAQLQQVTDATERAATRTARTAVHSAAEAGSLSQLVFLGYQDHEVQKEWVAVHDDRTRPTHVAADGQRVRLYGQFEVGASHLNFPGDPAGAWNEIWQCRCTTFFHTDVTPAKRCDGGEDCVGGPPEPAPTTRLSLGQLRRQAVQRGLVLPPDTTKTQLIEAIAADQQAAVERAFGEVRARFEELGLPPVARAVAGPAAEAAGAEPVAIVPRAALLRPKTVEGVKDVWQREMKRITGRDIPVSIPTSVPSPTSVLTVREYAEGVLRGLEAFPDAQLLRVEFAAGLPADEYAHVIGGVIRFNGRLANEKNRPLLISSLRDDIAKWDQGLSGWYTRGDGTPASMALHEFGHILDIDTLDSRVHTEALLRMDTLARQAGVDTDTWIHREISAYAGSDAPEMVAEAFADVLLRGAQASVASRRIYELLEREYLANGGRAGASPGSQAARAVARPAEGPAVRQVLQEARTTGAVERVFREEYERITGRPMERRQTVSFAGSAATAREHAEGILRGLERFPDVRIDSVGVISGVTDDAYATAGGGRISFSYRYTSPDGRKAYLESLQKDVANWDKGVQEWGLGIFRRSGFHPRGTGNPQATAVHEFGHVLDLETLRSSIRADLDALLERRFEEGVRLGRPAGETALIDVEDLIFREVSGYATKNRTELVAEAFSDVMVNGTGASQLSRDIFALLEDAYRARGHTVGGTGAAPGIAPTVARVVPKTPVARAVAQPAELPLARRPVAELRQLARDRGLTVPAGARKADLVRLLEQGPPTELQQAAQAARARQALIDTHRGIGETLAEVLENVRNGADPETVARLAQGTARRLGVPQRTVNTLLTAVRTGDPERIRTAVAKLARTAKVTLDPVAELVPFDRTAMQAVGKATIRNGQKVQVLRPGVVADVNGETVRLSKSVVRELTAEEVQTIERRALREAARVQAAQIAAARGTADLLAEVDQLLAQKAEVKVIRERLDRKLLEPEQLFAGADEAVRAALATALDTGDLAQVRAVVTRQTTRSKLKPISKAGTKTKFDPDTMEPVGAEIKAGTQVTVVTRGASVTLPDGTVVQLAKAKVTPVAPKPVKAMKVAERPTLAMQGEKAPAAAIRTMHRLSDPDTGMKARISGITHGANNFENDYAQFRGWSQVDIEISSAVDPDLGGYATVIISPDGRTVYFPALALEAEAQGQGFVTRLMGTLFERYQAAGVKTLGIRANADVGGYAWARAGFSFFDGSARAEFARYARAYARGEAVKRYTPQHAVFGANLRAKLDPATRKAILAVADNPNAQPIDYAMIGHVGGSKLWPGKEFMLGSFWRGKIEL